MLMVSKMTMAL